MSLTGKTIGELTKLSAITETTLFPVEFSGETFHIPYSSITTNIKPYKVYTALLTQTGGGFDMQSITSGDLTIGVTYLIPSRGLPGSPDWDFTNVGAPNNDMGTYFVATGITPNNWGVYGELEFNTAAPVVTVLENTIGNIWFSYEGVGSYGIDSNSLFTANKTASFISGLDGGVGAGGGSPLGGGTSIVIIDTSNLYFSVLATDGNPIDGYLNGYPIEIRVYN